MTSRHLVMIALLALILAPVGWGLRASAGEPEEKPAAPSSDPAQPYDAEATAAERERNLEAYAHHVGAPRMYLIEEHFGQWVAIAGGRAFPVNEFGTAVAPAATMDEAVAAARAAVPRARHRFVFRIGEEGDFEQGLGGAEIPHVLGVYFLAKLERPDVEIRSYGPNQPIHFVKGDVRKEITAKGPDSRMFVRPEVGPPGADGAASSLYVLSTGFAGFAVVPATTASDAMLHLWEVPGEVAIDGVFRTGTCRRTRMRLRFPDTDLDFLLPVAVWPE
jgi:hypothetical protein